MARMQIKVAAAMLIGVAGLPQHSPAATGSAIGPGLGHGASAARSSGSTLARLLAAMPKSARARLEQVCVQEGCADLVQACIAADVYAECAQACEASPRACQRAKGAKTKNIKEYFRYDKAPVITLEKDTASFETPYGTTIQKERGVFPKGSKFVSALDLIATLPDERFSEVLATVKNPRLAVLLQKARTNLLK